MPERMIPASQLTPGMVVQGQASRGHVLHKAVIASVRSARYGSVEIMLSDRSLRQFHPEDVVRVFERPDELFWRAEQQAADLEEAQRIVQRMRQANEVLHADNQALQTLLRKEQNGTPSEE